LATLAGIFAADATHSIVDGCDGTAAEVEGGGLVCVGNAFAAGDSDLILAGHWNPGAHRDSCQILD
jgi:hypothetical protein